MTDSTTDIHILESNPLEAESTRVKKVPKAGDGKIPVPFVYVPSDDGIDENLLVLLHGLGDTHAPFAKMGKQLKLPQTAVLALRAPERIPFLYEESYQWYASFDALGELIPNPNPTPAIELLNRIVMYLTTECDWQVDRLHWFGFAQGGSVVSEFGLWWFKEKGTGFGSIVTVCGKLISYPTLGTAKSRTPMLVVSRAAPPEMEFSRNDRSGFQKGYAEVQEVVYSNGNGGMPVGKAEWEAIMGFWSERLGRRIGGGGEAGIYEVV